MHGGFLEDVLDDRLWLQINLHALLPQSTPSGCQDALYFVMDQVKAFDEDESTEEESRVARNAGNPMTKHPWCNYWIK